MVPISITIDMLTMIAISITGDMITMVAISITIIDNNNGTYINHN